MTPDRRFEYHSLWVLDAPVSHVWQALTEVEHWPRWWPQVRAVRQLRWATRLPYGFTLTLTCTEAQRERRLAGRSVGDLCGEGVWELQPRGAQTLVRYRWTLDVNRRWMRWLAPLLAPLFAWNHHGVMRAGEQGLRRYLAGRAEPVAPGP